MQNGYGFRQNEYGGYSRPTIHHEPHHAAHRYYQPPSYSQQHWNHDQNNIVQTKRLTKRNCHGSDWNDNQSYKLNPYHLESNHSTLSKPYNNCDSSNQTSTHSLTSERENIRRFHERSSKIDIGKDAVYSSVKVEEHADSALQWGRTSKRRIINSTKEAAVTVAGCPHQAPTGDGDTNPSPLSPANQSIPKKSRPAFGIKMLKKMGWKPDTGLGKSEDGRKTALEVVTKDDTEGIGFVRESIWELPEWGVTAACNQDKGTVNVDIEEIPWQLCEFNRENRRRAKRNRQG